MPRSSTFPLLSDFNKQVIRDYGVFNEDMIGLKGIAKRAVFVIDKDGVVRHREVLEDARNEPDYGQGALGALASHQAEQSYARGESWRAPVDSSTAADNQRYSVSVS